MHELEPIWNETELKPLKLSSQIMKRSYSESITQDKSGVFVCMRVWKLSTCLWPKCIFVLTLDGLYVILRWINNYGRRQLFKDMKKRFPVKWRWEGSTSSARLPSVLAALLHNSLFICSDWFSTLWIPLAEHCGLKLRFCSINKYFCWFHFMGNNTLRGKENIKILLL